MGILLTIALAIQLTISKGTDVGPENAPWAANTTTIDRHGRGGQCFGEFVATF